MNFSFSLVSVAIMAFASTNVDQIIVVSAFFADRRYLRRAVAIGQFIGTSALIGVSIAAALVALAVPRSWAALLGLAPLWLGSSKLWALRRDFFTQGNENADKRPGEAKLHSQVLAVAVATIANGGDNLSLYIPLFATNLSAIPVYVIVFGLMTALWCVFGFLLI